MKIGIGVITTDLGQVPESYYTTAANGARVLVHEDVAHLGPAHARNIVLKTLYDAGCDHIFTFDDDCYPLRPGWAEYVIDQAAEHGVGFAGMPNPFESKPLEMDGELVYWDSILGCFTYQTRRAMQAIGYYNTDYHRYGWEDCARSYRAVKAGITGPRPLNASFMRVPFYIHAEDAYGKARPSSIPVEEKQRLVELNKPIYLQEIESDQLYYPFS